MNPVIVIFGANGFLGRYLSRYFARQGKEVVCIARTRRGWSGDGMFLEWNGRDPGPWTLALEGAETVINLTGRSVDCRYTPENRREILDSRVVPTITIGKAIAACKIPPKCWINSSTATFYRHAADHAQDDWTGEPGEGFSVDVARAWEEAFFSSAVPAETRKTAIRTGIVLANEPHTAFAVLAKLAHSGLGGPMGRGDQRVSWVHIADFLRAVHFIAENPFFSGAVNLTAPEHPTNREMMRAFREVAGMPIGIPATEWMIQLGAVFMKTEPELVLKSRWARPTRLKDAGFRWRWQGIGEAIADLAGRKGIAGFFRDETAPPQGARPWIAAANQ